MSSRCWYAESEARGTSLDSISRDGYTAAIDRMLPVDRRLHQPEGVAESAAHRFRDADARPAAIHPSRVRSDPASAATLATVRHPRWRVAARSSSGTGPDSTPPARIIIPL